MPYWQKCDIFMKLLDIINKRSENELQKVHEETFRSIKIFFLSVFCSFASVHTTLDFKSNNPDVIKVETFNCNWSGFRNKTKQSCMIGQTNIILNIRINFNTQIKILLQASTHGHHQILFPPLSCFAGAFTAAAFSCGSLCFEFCILITKKLLFWGAFRWLMCTLKNIPLSICTVMSSWQQLTQCELRVRPCTPQNSSCYFCQQPSINTKDFSHWQPYMPMP